MTAGVEDTFWEVLPEWLRPYFFLEPVAAVRLGVAEVDGVRVKGTDFIFPQCAVGLMCWNFALWI